VADGLRARQIGIVHQIFAPFAHALLVLLTRAALQDEEDQLNDDEEDDEDEQNPRRVVGQKQSGQIKRDEDGGHGANMSDGSWNQVNPFPNAVAARVLLGVRRSEEQDDRLKKHADPDDDEQHRVMAVIPVPDPAEVEEPKQQTDDGENDGDVKKRAMPGQPHFLAADRRVRPHAAIKGDE